MAEKKIVRTLATNLTLDTDNAKKGLQELTQAVKSANNEAKILEAQYKTSGNEVAASKAKYEGLTQTVEAQKAKVEALKKALEQNNDTTEAGKKNQEFLTQELAKAERQLGSYQGQLDKATQAYKYQESGLADLNKELKHSNEMADAHARKLEAEGKTAEAQEVRLKALKDTHANLSKQLEIQQKELKEMALAGDKNSDSYKKQELRVAQMSAKVSEASQDITKFTTKSKDVENTDHGFKKVTNTVEGLGKAFVPVVAGVTALAGAFGAYINKMADTNSQISGIQARTTQTYEQAKASYKAINDLYVQGYGDSLEELQETYTRVQQLNPSDSIQDLTEKTKMAGMYAQLTGADIQEVLAGASKATTNLGISYEEYFDLMTTASKKGLDTQGALSDEMAEYSQVLGQMGFSAKDAFGLLENGLKAGAYNTDKLSDFVKEFGISLNDGRMQDNIGAFSKNTQQMFNGFKKGQVTASEMLKAVTQDLAGMTDKQKEATLASNLWSALGEDNALKVVESMGQVNNSFDNVQGTAKATAEQLKNQNPFELAKRGAEKFTSELTLNQDQVNKLKEAFKPLAQELKKLFEAVVKELPTIAKNLTPIIDFTAKHLPELITGLGILGTLWGTTKIFAFGKSIASAGKDVADLAKKASGLIIKPKVDGSTAKRELGILSKAVVGVGKGLWWTAKLSAKAVWNTLALIGDGVIKTGQALKWTAKLTITGVKKGLSALTTAGKATGTALKKGLSVTAKIATQGAQVALKALATTGKATGLALKGAFTFLKANPLGLLITGITLAITALVALYKHNKKFRDFVNGIIKSAVEMAKDVAKWFSDMFKSVSKIFGKIGSFIGDTLSWIKKTWDKYWEAMSKFYSNVFKTISDITSKVLKSIANFISDTVSGIKRAWSNYWKAMSDYYGNIWKNISNLGSSAIKGISNIIHNVLSGINNIWRRTWQGLSDFFGGIWRSIKGFAQDGINGVLGVINKGVDAIDVVWKFFTGKATNIRHLQPVRFAQGGIVERRLAMVNDEEGVEDWKELIQLPDGKLIMSQQRNAILPLPVGTRVYNGKETKAIMNMAGIEKYAQGGIVGGVINWGAGALSNIGSWIGDKFDAISAFLKNPIHAVTSLIHKATSGIIGTLGNFGQLASGVFGKLTGSIANWFSSALKKIQDEGMSAPAGTGVQRWRSQVIKALEMNGLSTSEAMVNKILRQIQTESGGRERVIGGDDGLADGKAMGLLQVKPGTFNAYKFPGHNNILNGFDNMLAALNYAKNRYGKSLSFLGQGHGYANGGLSTRHKFTQISEDDKPEMVIPLDKMKSSRGFELLGMTAVAMASRDNIQTQQANTAQSDNKLIEKLDMLLSSLQNVQPVTVNFEVHGSLDDATARKWAPKIAESLARVQKGKW